MTKRKGGNIDGGSRPFCRACFEVCGLVVAHINTEGSEECGQQVGRYCKGEGKVPRIRGDVAEGRNAQLK